MSLYPLTLLYDGACPICRFEMDRLRDRDGLRRLAFVDITGPGFDAAAYGDGQVTAQAMQRLIHAVRPDGSFAVGVDALVLAYRAVGWGHWAAPSRLPGVRPLADKAYALFAQHRYSVSRWVMPWLAPLWAARTARRMRACDDGACAVERPNEGAQ